MPVHKLSSLQLMDLSEKLVAAATRLLPADNVTGQDVLGDLSGRTADLRVALGQSQASPFTEQKIEADELRDARTRNLLDRLEVTVADPDAEAAQRTAAQQLLGAVARRTSRFYESSYAENSSELSLLLDEWGATEQEADWTTLGLSDKLMLLRTAHEAFVNLTKAEAEAAESEEALTLRPIKRALRQDFRTLFTLVNHHARKNEAPYTALAGEIEELVAEPLTVARRRDTLADSGEAADEGAPLVGS